MEGKPIKNSSIFDKITVKIDQFSKYFAVAIVVYTITLILLKFI